MSLGKEFPKAIKKNLVRLNLVFTGRAAILMNRYFQKPQDYHLL